MQREIKFRGKRVDNGEWVYGYYFISERDIEDGFVWRDIPQIQQRYGDHYQYFDVIPETIGQYTGLKDRNGTELYEKDIILFDSKRLFVIVFNKYGQFCVKSPEDLQDEIYAGYCIPDSKKIERIGNIYENPELLSKVE
jgi:uncharacterized phage protein (TIGR01671 family)